MQEICQLDHVGPSSCRELSSKFTNKHDLSIDNQYRDVLAKVSELLLNNRSIGMDFLICPLKDDQVKEVWLAKNLRSMEVSYDDNDWYISMRKG